MAPFDADWFYLYLANSLVAFPEVRPFIDKLYQSQKIRFYENAKANKCYDATIMQDRPLELEVSMKRAFGILLCSQDDEQLQKSIIAEIDKTYPPIKKLGKNFSIENYAVICNKYLQICTANNTTSDRINAFPYFVAYKLFHYYGLETEDRDVQYIYNSVKDDIQTRQDYELDAVIARVDAIRAKELFTVPQSQQKLYAAIQNGRDILDILDIAEKTSHPIAQISMTAASQYKKDLFVQLSMENKIDSLSAMLLVPLLCREFELYGLSLQMFFSETQITKKEKERALNILADTQCVYRSIFNSTCSMTLYMATLLFGQLGKFLKASRDFYFTNNSETQYNELKKASVANAELREKIADLDGTVQCQAEHIDILKSQVDKLSTELSKDTKEAVRPLSDEIAFLRSQISSLKKELEAEKEKTNELNRLREFVFSIQSSQDIAKADVSLKDLIAGKRIYIFGGHINWRNKMKTNYPSLNILDGHQESFDEQILLNADMVLLNTSNMSHSLYYKVIDVLRKNKIPFDYVGKYTNTELLENEIAEILQRTP